MDNNFKSAAIIFLIAVLSLSASNVVSGPAGNHPRMLLTEARLAEMQAKMNSDDEVSAYFFGQLDSNSGGNPYGVEEWALAYALGYRLTGNADYRDNAVRLAFNEFNAFDADNLWFQDRNNFRRHGYKFCLFFDWIYDGLTANQRTEALDAFRAWGEYWRNYVHYDENFAGYVWTDSDETTSLAENFLMLGLAMYSDDQSGYQVYADLMIEISDAMSSRFVEEFMTTFMRGGVWAEGVRYNPGTCKHWIRMFMLNREMRGIPYPNNYLDLSMKALIHQTFPGYTSLYLFSDVEDQHDDPNTTDTNESDYLLPGNGEYDQYDYVITLIAALDDPDLKGLGQNWINTVKEKNQTPFGGMFTGVWRMIFENADAPTQTPQDISLPTEFYSPGNNFIAMRENWTENMDSPTASNTAIYFQNSKWYVDHMHDDALAFDIFRNGKVVSRESVGYGGMSAQTYAHNSLLIENQDNWGSNVNYRAQGQGRMPVISFGHNAFKYIEADAADVYNYRVWQGDFTYVDEVNRKLIWIKPGYIVVYDYVKLVDDGVLAWPPYGNEDVPDGNMYDGHKRRVRYVQHFQVEPQLADDVYSTHTEGQSFFVKTILPIPADTTTAVIDERNGGDPRFDGPEYQMPNDQKKWHIEVGPAVAENQTRLLHALYFDADTVTSMPDTNQVAVLSGNMLGAYIGDTLKNYITLFGSGVPGNDVEQVSYSITTTAPSKHILVDMQPDTLYTVKINGVASSVASDSDGILTFEDSGTGNRNYALAANRLSDIINILQVLSEQPVQETKIKSLDVTGDGKAALDDALYILRNQSGAR